jgi:hypothetical protein
LVLISFGTPTSMINPPVRFHGEYWGCGSVNAATGDSLTNSHEGIQQG